ncbi:MAG: hypothetical protein OXG85_14715 [Chloroflexi bacterium]|nr:hypothetical protein [Chloroflexota bacterium]
MSADDQEQRYDDILRRIAKRRPFGSAPDDQKPGTPHDRALDMVNAFDTMAELAQGQYAKILCYGPQALQGRAWSGAVIWYHKRGYHGYQTLSLFGLWAHYHDSRIVLSAGLRQLPYRAPVYDPGVYRVAIRNGFQLYYDDDGRPPDGDDRLLYRAPFELKERLKHRQALAEILTQWAAEV